MLSESTEVVPTTQYPNSSTAGTTWLPTVISENLDPFYSSTTWIIGLALVRISGLPPNAEARV